MTSDEIRNRIRACDANELAAYRDHAATLQRIRTSREYVQAECSHGEIEQRYEISHFNHYCKSCGKKLR